MENGKLNSFANSKGAGDGDATAVSVLTRENDAGSRRSQLVISGNAKSGGIDV